MSADQEAVELRARLDALKPEMEKVHQYRRDIQKMICDAPVPEIENKGLEVAVQALRAHLLKVCEDFSGFNAGKGNATNL